MMVFDGWLDEMPAWLDGQGPAADIVVSTRARLARNLAGRGFPHRLDEAELNNARKQLTEVLRTVPAFEDAWTFDLAVLEPLERLALREAHLASRDLLREPEGRALVLARARDRAAMINEEDHLRLQAYRSGFDPLQACQDALEADRQLEVEVDLAFSDEIGYLTACPTNVGTGLRLSALIHLPGLMLSGEVDKMLNSLRQLQFAVRGYEGEGSAVRGALFQVSNLTSLGRSEQDLATDFARHVSKVIHYEQMALARLHERDPITLEDLAHRALAVLQHARVLTYQELLDRLSQVRMGVILEVLPRIDMGLLNQVLVQAQSGHLQIALDRELAGSERGAVRADLVRRLLRDV
ncbi:ATP--guanido phosphotransferase [bacterium]|nr:ATP--guanido phosphotransferase [bacterium]